MSIREAANPKIIINNLCERGLHKPVLIQEKPFKAIVSVDGSVTCNIKVEDLDDFTGRVVCLRCGKPLRYRVEYWRIGDKINVILRECVLPKRK